MMGFKRFAWDSMFSNMVSSLELTVFVFGVSCDVARAVASSSEAESVVFDGL